MNPMAEPKSNPNSAPEFNRSEDCLPRKNKKEMTDMNPVTEVKTNPNAATDNRQRIWRNNSGRKRFSKKR